MRRKQTIFLNQNAAPPPPPTKWEVACDIWANVNILVVIFVCIVLTCAFLYFLGSRSSWGIQPTYTSSPAAASAVGLAKPGILDCLHFSVVTIATLGYGDFRPESYGRLVAGLEVISGVILVGVFVSRLVSRRQDRFTKRLVTGQLNAEIQDFRDSLAELLLAFRNAPPIQEAEASEILLRANGLAKSIGRYWRHEAHEPDLAEVIQLRAAGRLLGGLLALLNAVTAYAEGKSRPTLHHKDRVYVRNITESVLLVATVLSSRIEDDGLRHSHSTVVALVEKLRVQFLLQRQPW